MLKLTIFLVIAFLQYTVQRANNKNQRKLHFHVKIRTKIPVQQQ